MSSRVICGDCRAVMRSMDEASVDAIVTDPPYGLEFMGKEWDSFAPRDRKNASVWDGRRQGQGNWEAEAASRSGRGGGGRSYQSGHKGSKRCAGCGKREFSGSPCECDDPQWVIEHRQEAPSAMIGFQAWCEEWAREAYRVLRPGGHLLAFGGSRTYHRLASAIEDAGFEVRDQVMWLYGSGFPKSRDVSKAIDEEAGAEREVVGRYQPPSGEVWNLANDKSRPTIGTVGHSSRAASLSITAPATDAARQWAGWGTALKPAHEPLVLARKPLGASTVAANVLAHGTGALNVDACRVPGQAQSFGNGSAKHPNSFGGGTPATHYRGEWLPTADGRWPANVIHSGDDEVEAAFAAFGSDKGAAAPVRRRNGDKFRNAYGAFKGDVDEVGSTFRGDTGTASRFFYCAKAGRNERWKHVVCRCSAQVIPPGHVVYKLKHCPVCGDEFEVTAHPTQKPESLMRYLCRLITPPGGTVLDMFAGSGSTGCAALAEGFGFVGIEADEIYAGIAEARIAAARVGPKARAKATTKVPPPDLFSLLAAE